MSHIKTLIFKKTLWFRLTNIRHGYLTEQNDGYFYTKQGYFCCFENPGAGDLRYRYSGDFLDPKDKAPINLKVGQTDWSLYAYPTCRESIKFAKGILCHTLSL